MNEHEGRTFEQARAEIAGRNVTAREDENPERFALYRLCECASCEGTGKRYIGIPGVRGSGEGRCPDCRGEGRTRDLIATAGSPEAVGVAIVTLAREGEWEGCPIGILDTLPPCPNCEMDGWLDDPLPECPSCSGTGIKQRGTWLVRPWTPSARNVTDAARTLAKSKTKEKT